MMTIVIDIMLVMYIEIIVCVLPFIIVQLWPVWRYIHNIIVILTCLYQFLYLFCDFGRHKKQLHTHPLNLCRFFITINTSVPPLALYFYHYGVLYNQGLNCILLYSFTNLFCFIVHYSFCFLFNLCFHFLLFLFPILLLLLLFMSILFLLMNGQFHGTRHILHRFSLV